MRGNSAYLLGVIGDDSSVNPLLELIKNENEEGHIKASSAKSLGRIGNRRAVEPLLSLIPSTYPDLNKVVVGALGQIGDISFIEPLILGKKEILRYSSDYISDAISNIGEVALPILSQLSVHENNRISICAKISMVKIKKKSA